MWVIYAGIIAGIIVLLLISRSTKADADADMPAPCRLFLKPAAWLEERLLRLRQHLKMEKEPASRLQLKEDMEILYPREAKERLKSYNTGKLSTVLFLISIGALLSMAFYLSALMNKKLSEDGWLQRNSYGKGSLRVELEAWEGKKKEELQLEVQEREYTSKQLGEMLPEVRKALENEVRGDNSTLNEVSKDLNFPSSLPGYPFQITWECGNYKLIHSDGKVTTKQLGEKGEITELRAVLTCGEEQWEEIFAVRVCPPALTEEERFRKLLEETAVKREKASRQEEGFLLPERVEMRQISWKEKITDNSILLFALFVAAGCILYRLQDRDLKKKLEQREEQLLLSYPEFISKLALLMGAGLPIRSAFQRMAADYQNRKTRKQELIYVYEELTLACREMESGITEAQAYEHFGQRCRLTQYRKCAALLSQNLKKGASGLLQALQQEAEHAFEERKRNARELGEKAGTRLLLPMMLMLVVVMVLIMVPACFSFAGM